MEIKEERIENEEEGRRDGRGKKEMRERGRGE